MKNILVTSGETRVAYNICKSLSKLGYKVYVGNRTRFSMAAISRHCSGSMTYASPFTEEDKFIEDIKAFAEQKKIDIIVPVLEESYTVAKNRAKLAGTMRFFLPEYTDIIRVHDKGSLAKLVSELNIPRPETVELADVMSKKVSAGSLSYPVMLKPKQGGGGWGMKKFFAPDEFLDFARQHVEIPERYIVQEIIEGQLIGVCAVCKNGEMLAGDSYKSTRVFPLRYGQPTARESIPNDEALKYLEALLAHLKWNGVCEADFITAADGQHQLLDVNPRFWGSVAHNIAAGVNYPYYYCLLASGEESIPRAEAKVGTKTRWLGGEIMRFMAEFKQAESKAGYLKKTLSQSAKTDAYDDWALLDPLPFFSWAISSCLNKVFKRQKDSLPGIWK